MKSDWLVRPVPLEMGENSDVRVGEMSHFGEFGTAWATVVEVIIGNRLLKQWQTVREAREFAPEYQLGRFAFGCTRVPATVGLSVYLVVRSAEFGQALDMFTVAEVKRGLVQDAYDEQAAFGFIREFLAGTGTVEWTVLQELLRARFAVRVD